MREETPEAKLRNQLTPAYGLADIVLLLETDYEKFKPLAIEQAKQVVKNKKEIDRLLLAIENKNG